MSLFARRLSRYITLLNAPYSLDVQVVSNSIGASGIAHAPV